MEKILSNPYRVLGLISPISNKELAKRKNDLSTFVEFGKIPSYPLDFISSNNTLHRDSTAIEDAARHLEGDDDRLINALFWFYKYDAVDEFAFEAIEEGDYPKAKKMWDEQIKKSAEPKFSWLINANVLSFLSSATSSISYDNLQRMINQYASVVSHIDKIKADVLKASKNTVDINRIIYGTIDSFIQSASKSTHSSLSLHNLSLLEAFSNYPESAKDYAESKIVTPCLNLIEDTIKEVEQTLEDEYEYIFYVEVENLKQQEGLIRELDLYADSYKVRRLVNDYAEVAKRCAIFAYNKVEDMELSTELIEWTDELPAYGDTKNSIVENKEILANNVKYKETSKMYEPLIGYLQTDIYSIESAKRLQNVFYTTYTSLPYDIRTHDDVLKDLTSAFVIKIINFCVEDYNKFMDTFSKNPDLFSISNKIQSHLDLLSSVQSYLINIEAEESLTKTQKHLKSEKADIERIRSGGAVRPQATTVRPPAEPIAAGILSGVSNHTGISVGYMRIGYVITAFITGVWPLIVLYAVLTIAKNFIENNN